MTCDVFKRISCFDRRKQMFPDKPIGRVRVLGSTDIYTDYVFSSKMFDPFFTLILGVREQALRRTA